MNKTIITGSASLVLIILILFVSISGLTGCATSASGQSANTSSAPFYPDRVVKVIFQMSADDWKYVQANAGKEEYVQADMWYDGKLINNIAVRPKGNSSLSTTIRQGSIKFSLKADLNFFNSERNLNGVKKLNFNNGFSDPTFMKEALSYELFEKMGLPAPRSAFVDVWVNDTHLGLYTMVEQVDQTFLARYFSNTNGNLYKPEMPAAYLAWTEEDVANARPVENNNDTGEDINIGGGNFDDIINALGEGGSTEESPRAPVQPGIGRFNFPAERMPPGNFNGENRPVWPFPAANMTLPNIPQGNLQQPAQGFAAPGMIGQSRQGNYVEQMGLKTNENKPNYTALFRFLNVLNNEPDDTFKKEIEEVLNVDAALRYIAVSTALVHLDNYTGMGHNYYLYEVNGKFTVIPWDLNMSFGGFNSGLNRDGIINFLIDEPVAGALSARPLVARLLAVPEYLETYHGYLKEIIEGPFSSGVVNARIDEIKTLIRPYVEKDTLKFFNLQAFDRYTGEGNETLGFTGSIGMGLNIALKTFVAERNKSIKKQLAGEIPSTNNGSGNSASTWMMDFFPGLR